MRNLALRAAAGVCLLTAPFCCCDAYGGQGLSSLTPAKEYIYLGGQMIAVEMAPGASARASVSPANAPTFSGRWDLPLSASRSKLPLQQGYAVQLKQAIASGAPAVTEGGAR